MSSFEDKYNQMDNDQLKSAYRTSAGLHKRIIENILLERQIDFSDINEEYAEMQASRTKKQSLENLAQLVEDETISFLMQMLKSDTLNFKERELIQQALLRRDKEFEEYAYEMFTTRNFSHKLVQPQELIYRLSLIEIEKLSTLVQEGRDYEAIHLFANELKNITEVHDALLTHYNNIYSYTNFLNHFKSKKMRKYNYALPQLTLPDETDETKFPSEASQEQRLIELGYSSRHWYINSFIINKCEYLFDVLTNLIEPDYEYKNYDLIHDFNETMTPEEYESYCATILDDNGWEASLTKGTGDQGADVIGRKNGLTVIIQCKFYSSPVGNKAVQEVHAAVSHYHGEYGIVVTNNTFTEAAKELARSTNTILTHHNNLANILNDLTKN